MPSNSSNALLIGFLLLSTASSSTCKTFLWIRFSRPGGQEVNDILDCGTYRGIPEFFAEGVKYQTQGVCRKDFILGLIHGKFLRLPESDLEEFHCETSCNIGTCPYIVADVVRECNSAFEQKVTPGSWKEDEVASIIPGINFDPFI